MRRRTRAWGSLFLHLLLSFENALASTTTSHIGVDETTTSLAASVSSASASSSPSGSLHSESAVSSAAYLPLPAPSQPSISTCRSKTINYLTHTLPQQCLRSSRSAATPVEAREGTDGGSAADVATAVSSTEGAPGHASTSDPVFGIGAVVSAVSSASPPPPSESPPATPTDESDADTDSPLDNAHFLSFEEWKKQNLEKSGQSPEHVGQGRAGTASAASARKHPDIGSLDSLGEEGEIEFDFGGFGGLDKTVRSSAAQPNAGTPGSPATDAAQDAESQVPASLRSKDAGKTCKERYNYASFDCAATVLKTNPRCKSATSVLVENKDSYMLNECAAENKFLIVELCDDIIVDTVVLANFEFFSSMVRTFRVSVSDRYPPKPGQWIELGTFEARNSRDIQAFLVEGPRVWARYLRVEFVTHYGNEYYCPVSLLRVHGITMMEEYKHEEERARGDTAGEEEVIEEAAGGPEDIVTAEAIAVQGAAPIKASQDAPPSGASVAGHPPDAHVKHESEVSPSGETLAVANAHLNDPGKGSLSSGGSAAGKKVSLPTGETLLDETFANAGLNTARTAADDSHANTPAPVNSVVEVRVPHEVQVSTSVTSTTADPEDAQQTQVGGAATLANGNHSAAVNSLRPTNVTSAETAQSKTSVQSSAHQEHSKSPSASVAVHPPAPSPSTQESFFKSINKRLQALESNASLSLQYIEEQSRILRDAFTKVEKRQLNKTETFLTHLNSTVMAELRTFRSQYDQLWQSTVIELETHREQNQREILAISSRLSLLADELVFQKRMAVVQSTLLLMCLGFVLFVGTGGSNLELPIMQSVMNRGQKLRMVVPFETPPLSPHRPGSPDSGAQAERRPGFSRFFKGARARARGSPAHADQPIVEVSAPTPASGSPEAVRSRMRNEIVDSQSESERSVGQIRPRRTEDDSSDVESSRSSGSSSSGNIKQVRPRPRRVRSGPATPQGTRDNPLDWEPAPSTLADGSPESSPPVEETSDPQHESGHGQVHPSAKQSGVDGIGG